MGMMLRRHKRTPDVAPMVNGKPVKQEPKNRSLTQNKDKTTANTATPNYK
jgi:hypothetical protein